MAIDSFMPNESFQTRSVTPTAKAGRMFVFFAIAAYAISFVLICIHVFVENDESQPLREIFQWGYLIPVVGYSLFALWISFGSYLILHKSLDKFFPEKSIARIIALPLSLIIGVPLGLILLDKLLRSITA